MYLERQTLTAVSMRRGLVWLDTGTPESLYDASSFVRAMELRTGLLVGSPEEAAYRAGFITLDQLISLIDRMPKASLYRKALNRVAHE